MLSVTAFGCNQRLHKIIKRKLESLGHSGHSVFWEYFLGQPLLFRGKINEDMDPDKRLDVLFFAPFARRVAENSPTIPVIEEKKGSLVLEHRFASSEDAHPPLIFRCEPSSLLHVFYTTLRQTPPGTNDPLVLQREDRIDKCADIPFSKMEAKAVVEKLGYLRIEGGWLPFLPAVDHQLQSWKRRENGARRSLEKKKKNGKPLKGRRALDAVIAASKIYEYGYVESQFSPLHEGDRIFAAAFPICSSNILYGEFWFMMPPFARDVGKDLEMNLRRYQELLRELGEEIQKNYAPALALLHERFAEDSLKKVGEVGSAKIRVEISSVLSTAVSRLFGEKKTVEHEPVIYRVPFAGESPSSSGTTFADRIERHLFTLWERRSEESQTDKLKSSYLFSKYALCSPKMIALVVRVMEHAQRLRQGSDSDSQSSALVVGGAGSGKETLCRLIALFSSSYFRGDQFIVNLAALKPQQLATPLLTGASVTVVDPQKPPPNRGHLSTRIFHGIFSRIRERTEAIVQSAQTNGSGDGHNSDGSESGDPLASAQEILEGQYPMLILDELNSLDIESQGSLLRFLDNSEIIPIGEPDVHAVSSHPEDYEKLLSHCLVIGAMNEDPDELSREQAIKFIRDQEYLGGMIGDMLYEHFVRMRRLRPDVKYRLIRGGKFVIPALHERREDIPLLFDVYANLEVKGLSDNEKETLFNSSDPRIEVEFEALKALMDSSLQWPGNIRELQAVVKSAFQLAMTDADKPCTALRISRRHVRRALKTDDDSPNKVS